MAQLAWDEDATPKWFAEYERIAAGAITHQAENASAKCP
jgi:hypothetical protein